MLIHRDTLVNKYKMERRIGTGSISEVYVAKHIDTKSFFVVKIIPTESNRLSNLTEVQLRR